MTHCDDRTKALIETIKATFNDIHASLDGASEYERRIRRERSVTLYNNDATFREIMIRLDAMNRPWWWK